MIGICQNTVLGKTLAAAMTARSLNDRRISECIEARIIRIGFYGGTLVAKALHDKSCRTSASSAADFTRPSVAFGSVLWSVFGCRREALKCAGSLRRQFLG